MAAVGEHVRARTEFGAALEELVRAVLRASGRGVPGGETQLTLSQFYVIDALAHRSMTVSEVAREADVAVPTATRSLRSLERRGFVERSRGAGEDGRHVTIALTASGRTVLDEKRAWVEMRQRQIFEGLSASERRTAARTLTRIAAEIAEL
jgi:MarR family transcriptional regulator, organic hydroperoxide resistance regulator